MVSPLRLHKVKVYFDVSKKSLIVGLSLEGPSDQRRFRHP